MKADSTTIKVAAVQMNCVLADVDANLLKAKTLIDAAVEQGASLIVLPELFNTAYRVEEMDVELAETIPGPTTDWMGQVARESKAYLVASILETGPSNGVVYDTAVLVGPEGLVGSYRKTHLWDAENVRFTKGEEFPVFETALGKVGLQICYEVGFPEGARILTLKGADILVYPSAFGKARYYAWDLATRSRALENGAFVIAANRTGTEKNETIFGGHSRIVDPCGNVLAEASQEDDVVVAEINLQNVIDQRRTIPYLRDLNRTIIYKEFLKSKGMKL
jgi:predicted amidohydrolase